MKEGFRNKLDKWPNVSPRDAVGLQRFADYLKSCHDAIPFVPGLEVLSDCKANQNHLQKLPERIVVRWNRSVTDRLERGKQYPSFADFTAFVLAGS